MDLINFKETKDILSEGLFQSDKIKGMYIFMYQPFSLDDNVSFRWKGNIQFKNGSYSGEKEFKVDGKGGLEELLHQMNNFIKSL